MSGLLERIVRKAGVPELVEVLAQRLGASDLQSLLLEVYRRRAHAGTPGDLLARYAKSRFSTPSPVDVANRLAFDTLAFSLLPEGFEALELSPVAPLGATAVVTGTSQNRIVSTARNSEVAADTTNALALECALRRKEQLAADPRSAATVKLAASQRLVRAQQIPDQPNFFAHFRLFGLCSAGRDAGSFRFELEQLAEHVGFHVGLLEGWRARGAAVGSIQVPVTPLEGGPSYDVVRERVLAPLGAAHPEVRFEIDPERQQGRDYYRTLCFHVNVEAPDGELLQICDGGFTDWTAQLVPSRKERLMISGLGTERVLQVFGP